MGLAYLPRKLLLTYYLLVLVMGVNHSTLFIEGLEAGIQSSTQPPLPLPERPGASQGPLRF